ncbi:hypothetical protein AVEN_74445-1 [Araneus ventricosus]|uniref:Uncharacterized protein n=1 Tax=Araneus ventricosus TaxID=182803 RepID=A0A4Y2SZQ3_ARAVE|nr:hypothetical protein AVEN_74445-1 [Araneus ventricosus]
MAESKEITHAFVSLSDLSLDSSIFQELLKDSKRQHPSDDKTVRLDDTQFSAVAIESGDESAGDGGGDAGAGDGEGDAGAGDQKVFPSSRSMRKVRCVRSSV